MQTLLKRIAVLAVSWICATLPVLAASQTPPLQFQEALSFPLRNYWCENHLSVADMDGDGRKDIVLMATALVDSNGPPWRYRSRAILLRAASDGTFHDSVLADYEGSYGYGAVAADLNRDGAQDLILRESIATHILLNDHKGGFTEVWTGQPGFYSTAVADADRDGHPDFISGTQTGSGGLIELFRNDGTGRNFQPDWRSRLYGSGYDSIQTVLSLDLNNDGRLDLAAREIYSGLLITLLGSTNGPFVERSVMPLGGRTFAMAAGRANGDALPDLAAHVGWGRVQVFTNRGDGSVALHWQSEDLREAAFNLALADFDQDGLDDAFVGTFGDGALRILRNLGGAGFGPWWQGALTADGYSGSVADLNDDGYPDLIVGEASRIRVWINQIPVPRITSLEVGEQGATIHWNALPGKTYRVQSKDGLLMNEWTDLPGDITADTGTASISDRAARLGQQRFYRVVKLP